MMNSTATVDEILAVSASRLLDDGKLVFAGVGTPLLASILAQRTHAPRLTIVVEGGIVGPEIKDGELPVSTNEMRAGRHASILTSITDIFLMAQAGFFDYGFLGGAQIDPYGNINTSVIGDPRRPSIRLPGSGGANDIATHCHEVLIVTPHERRRFVEKLDFLTSPGLNATRLVTNLALFAFDGPSRRARLIALQPGVRLDDVRAATGFEFETASRLTILEAPTTGELSALDRLRGGAARQAVR